MPVPRVRSDYAILQTIARSFAAEAQALQQAFTNTKQALETLRSGDWVGKGATAFYSEMDAQVFPATGRLVAALTRAEQMTQQMLQVLQTAERDAAACFRETAASGEAMAAFTAPPPPVERAEGSVTAVMMDVITVYQGGGGEGVNPLYKDPGLQGDNPLGPVAPPPGERAEGSVTAVMMDVITEKVDKIMDQVATLPEFLPHE